MIAVVEHSPQVTAGLGEPEYFAQWYTFPDPVSERTAYIQAGHYLGEADRMLLCQFHQLLEGEGGVVFFCEFSTELGLIFGIRNDFKTPGVTGQADFFPFGLIERMGLWVTTGDIPKSVLSG